MFQIAAALLLEQLGSDDYTEYICTLDREYYRASD
jgi:hypothetical protein